MLTSQSALMPQTSYTDVRMLSLEMDDSLLLKMDCRVEIVGNAAGVLTDVS
jgi:hypothetical protein